MLRRFGLIFCFLFLCFALIACDEDNTTPQQTDHTCSFDITHTVEATCLEQGRVTRVCSVCQKEETEILGYADHTMIKILERQPTCTEHGFSAHRECSLCGHVEGYTDLGTLPHQLVTVDEKAPTCTEEGHTAYEYCANCDYTTIEILPAAHRLVHVDAKIPTCTEEGHNAYDYCENCDYQTEKRILPKEPHALTSAEGKAPTCTEDGYTAYEYCTNCDYTTKVILPAGHSLMQADEKSPTCTEDGYTAHEYCTNCDYTTKVILPAGHSLMQADEKSPTCTEDGYTAHEYCTNCDYTTKVILPAGHTLIQVAEKAPTCYEDGHNAYEYCTQCEYTTEQILPAGHTLISVDAKPSTCSEAGHTAYEYCSVCDYTTIEELPLKEHTLIFMAKKDPTCMTEGHTPYEYCTSCTYTTYVSVPKIAHQYSDEWTADVLATPEQKGVASRHCIYSDVTGCGMRTDVTEYEYEAYTEGLCFTILSSGTYMVSVGEAVGKDIIIPKTYLGIPVTVIGDFTGGIKSISIPEGITEIAGGAFYGGQVESGEIAFPDSLRIIGAFAFIHSNVHTVDFGSSVPIYDYTTFGTLFHAIYVDSLETFFAILVANPYGLFQYGGHLYVNGTLLEGNVIISDGCTKIPIYAFHRQLHVTAVTIPASVQTLGTDVLIHSGVTDIYYLGTLEEWGAITRIGSCDGWEKVRLHIGGIVQDGHAIIPDGYTEIPWSSFYNRSDVTSVTIPASVRTIRSLAIVNSGVTDIYFEGTLEQWCTMTIESGAIDWEGITLHINGVPVQGELRIPETVTEIGAYTFTNQAITKLYLHTGVLSIGDHAFSGTLLNQDLFLHEGVEAIGEKAFYRTKLHTVSLPSTLTVIGEAAFSSDVSVLYYHCVNAVIEGRISCVLLHIGAEVESIPDHAFNPHYVAFDENSRLTSIGSGAFHSFFLATICLPDSVTEIAEDAFAGCTNLGSAYCPPHVTLLLPDSPDAVIGSTLLSNEDGYFFMENNGVYYLVAMPTDLLGHVTLPTHATETAGYTVHAIPYLPGVTGLTSPKSATLACVGNLVEYLPDLTTLIINGKYTCSLSSLFDKLEHLELLGDEGRPSLGGTALRYLVLGGQGTEIPAGAFANCTALETVILLDGLERIEGGSFKNCISLRYLLVPDSVTYLGWDVVSEWTRIGLAHTDLDEGFFGSYHEYNVKEYYFTGTEFGYIDHEGQTHVLPIVELPTEPEEDDSVIVSPGDPPAETLPGAYVQDGVHCYDIDANGNYIYRAYLGEIENGVLVLPETLDGHSYCIDSLGLATSKELVEVVVPRAVVRIRGMIFYYGYESLERVVFEDKENWRWNASMNPRAHWPRCAECSARILQSDLLSVHSMFHSSLLTN